jgi:nitrogen fixation protein FixH
VSIAPGAVTVRLRDAQGRVLDAAEVTLELANSALGVEGLERRMQRVTAGDYRFEGESYFAGSWRIVVHARIGEFEKVTFR